MKKKKMLLSAALLILAAAAGPVTTHAEDATVTIADPYLNKVIYNSLGKTEDTPITKEEMLSITELSSDSLPYVDSPAEDLKEHNRGIVSLEGLQYAENLVSLDLSENRICDLSPLSELKNLTYLELDRNNIRDLSPLSGLSSLEHLNIYNNFLEDITPLSNLHNLQFLDMHYANREGTVIDHTPLSSLTSLNYLSVESNHLSDIHFLQPLAESGNLKTILVRANSITDFSVLSDMLYQEYQEMYPSGMPGLEEPQETSIMVGTNNQTPLSEPLQIQAPSEGGEIRIALPKFSGFEKVEEYFSDFASMMEMDLRQLSLEDTTGDVDVFYDSAANEAVFSFSPNIVGTPIDFSTRLILGIWGTDFEAQMPVHITQSAEFNFDLNIENGSKQILFIDTDQEEYISSDYVTGKITNLNGSSPVLKDVQISFTGTCEWRNSISQDIFSADDVQINGDHFRFKIKQDKDRSAKGNFLLNPTIQFQIEGSDSTYTLERGAFKIYNVYVASDTISSMDDRLTFDIASLQDGTCQSAPFGIQFENNARSISSVTVEASSGSRLSASVSEDKSSFTIQTDTKGLKDVYTIQIFFETGGANEAPIYLPSTEPKLIYSTRNSSIEDQLTLSPLTIEKGAEATLQLLYQGSPCSEFIVSSDSSNIVEVSGNTLKGLNPGSGTVQFSDVTVPYPVEGEVMNVTYLPGKAFNITVTETVVPPSTGNPDTADDTSQTGSSESKLAPAAKTGDTSDVLPWFLICMGAFVLIMVCRSCHFRLGKK